MRSCTRAWDDESTIRDAESLSISRTATSPPGDNGGALHGGQAVGGGERRALVMTLDVGQPFAEDAANDLAAEGTSQVAQIVNLGVEHVDAVDPRGVGEVGRREVFFEPSRDGVGTSGRPVVGPDVGEIEGGFGVESVVKGKRRSRR